MVAPEMGAPTYALIGLGPRGLTVLERFVSLAANDPHRIPRVLHVVEPGPAGPGLHFEQPDYLLLNTIAAQLTTFVDGAMIAGGGVPGPSLYEWAREQGLRYTSNTGETRAIRPTDHLTRTMLGRYLQWSAQRLIAARPSWLDIRVHRCAALGIQSAYNGRELVYLSSGRTIEADQVTITVGHSATRPTPVPHGAPADAWIAEPYPLPASVEAIGSDEVVALLGGGLTAMDVIAACTVGRGGRYTRDGGELTYLPGGQEPRIVLISRQGRPARARPLPYRRQAPAARHLTSEAIRRLRARYADGRLDFRRDVLPLVRAEMAHRVETMIGDSRQAAAVVESVFSEWDGAVPGSASTDVSTYSRWFTGRITDDLQEARRGLDGSPVKFAFEVVRDYRETLRAAIDQPGMTTASLQHFFGPFVSAVNRNVICPQLERNEELLALVRAGVLEVGPGPAPVLSWEDGRWSIASTALATPAVLRADKVVCAFSPSPRVRDSQNPLVDALYRTGRIRPLNAGALELGVETDEAGHPIDIEGDRQPALTVLGPLTEGSSYYNHYVTSPGTPSRATADAHRTVRDAVALSPVPRALQTTKR